MLKKTLLQAAFVALFVLAGLPSLPAASFGPGRVQLIAGGGGEVLLDSPEKQVALRFVAERDGPLGVVKFASRIGIGWTDPTGQMFGVALFSDKAGKPDRQISVAADSPPTAPGARAREAVFKDVPLKGGQAYHLVITMPDADASKRMSVNYFLFDARSHPLDSYDMDTAAAGGDVLVSTDGGTTWTSVAQGAAGAMALMIGGRLQGWAYTNSYDARLWHIPGDSQQVLMQNFKFTTGGKGNSGQVGSVSFALRAQAGLAGTTVPLRVRLIDRVSGKPIGTATVSAAAPDAGHFFQVDAPFKNVALKDGGDYVLSLDIVEPAGTTPSDYLFVRTFTWGYGNPSLTDVGWQGSDHSLIQSPSLDPAAGQAVDKVDMPFVIDYTPIP